MEYRTSNTMQAKKLFIVLFLCVALFEKVFGAEIPAKNQVEDNKNLVPNEFDHKDVEIRVIGEKRYHVEEKPTDDFGKDFDKSHDYDRYDHHDPFKKDDKEVYGHGGYGYDNFGHEGYYKSDKDNDKGYGKKSNAKKGKGKKENGKKENGKKGNNKKGSGKKINGYKNSKKCKK